MGASKSVPAHSPLGIILGNWSVFSSKRMSKKTMVRYCNFIWPCYSLGAGKQWPTHGCLDHDTIVQLQVYCQEHLLHAVDYVNAFVALYHNANLRARYNCGAGRGAPREARQQDEVAAQTDPASGAGSSPPESMDRVDKPQPRAQRLPVSPSSVQQSRVSGTDPGSSPARPPVPSRAKVGETCSSSSSSTRPPVPSRARAGEKGPSSLPAHPPVPSRARISETAQQLNSSSSGAQQSQSGRQTAQQLTSSPSSAQQSQSGGHTAQQLTGSPSSAQQSQSGGDRPQLKALEPSMCPSCAQQRAPLSLELAPGTTPDVGLYKWRASGQNQYTSVLFSTVFPTRLDVRMVAERPLLDMEQWLLLNEVLQEALCVVPKRYDVSKALGVYQRPHEPPEDFLDRLLEAFRLFTPVDPLHPDYTRLVNMVFIAHSAPDIRNKLQDLPKVKGYSTSQLLHLAEDVFRDRDRLEKVREQRRLQRQRRRMRQRRDTQIARAVQKLAPQVQWEQHSCYRQACLLLS